MRIEDNVRIPKPVAGLLGFLLTFNFYLMPWSAQSLRATDFVGIAFLSLVMVLLLMGCAFTTYHFKTSISGMLTNYPLGRNQLQRN